MFAIFINFQACIFIGVFIMIASTIGGLRNIVADSSSYEFYSWRINLSLILHKFIMNNMY